MNRKIRVALPSKGRLRNSSLEAVKKIGARLDESDRSYIVDDVNGNFAFIFARTFDIPLYVHYGAADLGITGYDVILEREVDVYELLDLGFGNCSLVVAVPENSEISSIKSLSRTPRVATEYPNITRKYFESLGKQAEILTVRGTAELAPRLGLAEMIVDMSETGKTLKENGLKIIDKIFDSSCRLICNRISYRVFGKEINEIVETIKGRS
ncbi:MAG: ATP phosphoribosyltransferase [Candidatus Bathyarchaeia archaeon]